MQGTPYLVVTSYNARQARTSCASLYSPSGVPGLFTAYTRRGGVDRRARAWLARGGAWEPFVDEGEQSIRLYSAPVRGASGKLFGRIATSLDLGRERDLELHLRRRRDGQRGWDGRVRECNRRRQRR